MVDSKEYAKYSRSLKKDKHPFSAAASLSSGTINYNKNFLAFNESEMEKHLKNIKGVTSNKQLKEIDVKDKMLLNVLKTLVNKDFKNNEPILVALSSGLSTQFDEVDCNNLKVNVYHGVYEVPAQRVYEQGSGYYTDSGIVFKHIICTFTDGKVKHGFMYPALSDGAAIYERMTAI